MKKLNIKLEDLRQQNLKELFKIVESVFTEFEVEFYILGAMARDAWYAKRQIGSRTTRDVDFALYVSSQEQYDEIIKQLINKHGFSEIKGIPFRLQTPFDYTIDLIPFGEIGIDEAILPDETWDRPIFVNGFKEIFEHALVPVEVEDDSSLTFRVASLASIVLLKLIAYDDRPERRNTDPADISDIILHFFDIESEVIYEDHNDLFDRDLELHEIAAVVIGREMSEILKVNKVLRDRVLRILSLEERTQKKMAEAMARKDITLDQVERWFQLLREAV
ncbi:nucleotidyl transferase AbiEii/AbiGii toxin family protein [Rhodohalobacter sp.]|uniref:nucleotidyl transferase AbiEii/AbiGii toxin family protein n=1 Tax=Rhodohalobacter sp. TaxID=1974210 RepID=UPI002ACD6B3E|nr:nucleotidyl transferase AbiEii/AbiGii toxin family protein [Rhodohalobacter sp.]MDZ7758072.1 nucleotidyl transferase AbiEii/AbiGii toxin family protein [Rhodohalobacter sp.]